MASPAPIAALCLLARQGWPLIVAVLLTLWLGWSAVNEGHGVLTEGAVHPSTAALEAHAGEGPGELPPREPAAPRVEPNIEGGHHDGTPLPDRLCLLVPPSGPQATPLPVGSAPTVRLPGRRQPPSHAPPALLS